MKKEKGKIGKGGEGKNRREGKVEKNGKEKYYPCEQLPTIHQECCLQKLYTLLT